MGSRIEHHPVLGIADNGREISITFNGTRLKAREGDTIASALMANGIRTLRKHEVSGTPRGIWCNIGHCFECRVSAGGMVVRACLTPAQDGMDIRYAAQDRKEGKGT